MDGLLLVYKHSVGLEGGTKPREELVKNIKLCPILLLVPLLFRCRPLFVHCLTMGGKLYMMRAERERRRRRRVTEDDNVDDDDEAVSFGWTC